MQIQKTIDEIVIFEKDENAISITSRERKVRVSKHFDA